MGQAFARFLQLTTEIGEHCIGGSARANSKYRTALVYEDKPVLCRVLCVHGMHLLVNKEA